MRGRFYTAGVTLGLAITIFFLYLVLYGGAQPHTPPSQNLFVLLFFGVCVLVCLGYYYYRWREVGAVANRERRQWARGGAGGHESLPPAHRVRISGWRGAGVSQPRH